MLNEGLKIREGAHANVTRCRGFEEPLPLKGMWAVEHWKRKKSGLLYLADKFEIHNLITTPAKVILFDTMFNLGAQTTPASKWCGGLLNSGGTFNAGDTMLSHTGWTEYTAYSEGFRVQWNQQAATAGGAISNSTPMTFNIAAPGGTVGGLFLTNDNAKGGTAGLLWSAANYTSPVPVVAGDQIRSTYSLSA
jgi:hypothetical protein